jgi:hypothetical protein
MLRLVPTRFSRPVPELALPLLLVQELELLASVLELLLLALQAFSALLPSLQLALQPAWLQQELLAWLLAWPQPY